MSPLITVVIPTYQRPESLRRCLEALAAQTLEKDEYQIIVVDDGSSYDIESRIEPYRSRLRLDLLRQENEGPASARNIGVRAADGDFIAFTDDDCRPFPDWLEGLRDRLVAENEPCIVGGKVVNLLAANPFSKASQLILDMVYDHYNRDPENAYFFASMNIGLPRETFLACGGFDPAFWAAEDRDLCDRWRSNGHRLVYEPRAQIGHAHDLDCRSFWRQHLGYGRAAYSYHQARKARWSGTQLRESRFQVALPGLVLRHLRRGESGGIATQLAILILWQISNLAGFLDARLRGRTLRR